MNLCGETLRVNCKIYIFFIFAKFAKIIYFQPKNVFFNGIREKMYLCRPIEIHIVFQTFSFLQKQMMYFFCPNKDNRMSLNHLLFHD